MGWVFAIIVFLGIAYFVLRKDAVQEQEKRSAVGVYEFKKVCWDTNVLIVNKKSEDAVKCLTAEEQRSGGYIKEHPDQIVYTGATVGGVSMGGFHVEKGGIEYIQGQKNGKYRLQYKYASEVNGQPWGEYIHCLQLTDELYNEAKMIKHSPLSYYAKDEVELGYSYPREKRKNIIDLRGVDLSITQANFILDWLAGKTVTTK